MRNRYRWMTWLAASVVMALSMTGAALAVQKGKQPPKMDDGQKKDVIALTAALDKAVSGQAVPSTIAITWAQQHFIKALDRQTYVPFTVTIDPTSVTAPALSLYLRITAKGAAEAAKNEKRTLPGPDDEAEKQPKVTYPFEDIFFADAKRAEGSAVIRLVRAFSVLPGDYDVYVAVKERTPNKGPAPATKIGIVKQTVTVPDFWADEFTTSSVILSTKTEPLSSPVSPEQQLENPYLLGGARLTPSLDNKFSKKGEMDIVFWVYGQTVDTAKKPDVTFDYEFHQRQADGTEKFFNRTRPQTLNAASLPPEFDVAAGHQLPGSLSIPLGSFPEGEYRLAVKVTDNISKKVLNRDIKFTVTS